MEAFEDLLTEFACAHVRGALGVEGSDEELIRQGRAAGLKLHRFKRSALPRVRHCIGLLKGLRPATLLDVGSGRGAFLWTAMAELPSLDVTCVDVLQHRVDLINSVNKGGVARVRAMKKDVRELPFSERSFEAVTALEVLEHLPNPAAAVSALCNVGAKWLLVSVPSKADNNPEHIQLFSASDLADLLVDNGAVSVQLHHVLNHRIALAKLP